MRQMISKTLYVILTGKLLKVLNTFFYILKEILPKLPLLTSLQVFSITQINESYNQDKYLLTRSCLFDSFL